MLLHPRRMTSESGKREKEKGRIKMLEDSRKEVKDCSRNCKSRVVVSVKKEVRNKKNMNSGSVLFCPFSFLFTILLV